MASTQQTDNLNVLYEALMPALSLAAVGDYGGEIELAANADRRVSELAMGVQVLLEVIRELEGQLEDARSANTTLTLLDEVLKRHPTEG